MSIVKLLILIRSLPIKELLDFPVLRDSVDTRRYVHAVASALSVFAEKTATKFDDEVVLAVQSVVDNVEAWNALHGIFITLLLDEQYDAGEAPGCPDCVRELSERVGFNPMIILTIIQAIVTLLKFCKKDN